MTSSTTKRDPYQRVREALWSDRLQAYKKTSLEMINECLRYWLETQEPLPNFILGTLFIDVELLLSGREARVLKKGPFSNHPKVEDYKNVAVGYVKTCRKHGYDKHPVPTVCNKYNVKRKTVYEWIKEFPDANDDMAEETLMMILDLSADAYSFYRISKIKGKAHS